MSLQIFFLFIFVFPYHLKCRKRVFEAVPHLYSFPYLIIAAIVIDSLDGFTLYAAVIQYH